MEPTDIKMGEITELTSVLNEMKDKLKVNDPINYQRIFRKHGLNYNYFKSALKLGYFEKIHMPGYNGYYTYSLPHGRNFEPVHARKILNHYYKLKDKQANDQEKCMECGRYVKAKKRYSDYIFCSMECSKKYHDREDKEKLNRLKYEEDTPKTKNKKKQNAPTLQEMKKYFKENGYPEKLAEKAFKYYDAANWKDSRGHKVRNWKQKMQAVWFNESNRRQVSNDKTGVLQNKTTDDLYGLYFNIKAELLRRGEDANDHMVEEELHDQLKKRGYTGNLNLKFEF